MSRSKASLGVWFAVLAVGAGGCGNGGGDGASGCEDCGPYADVLDGFCGAMDRCPAALYPVAYRSRGECVAIMAWATTCRLEDDEVNDVHHYTLKRTIPTTSSDRVPACLAWLKAASCEDIARMNEDEEEDGDGAGAGSPDGGAAPGSPCRGIFRIPDDDGDGDSGGSTPAPAPAGEACRPGDQGSCLPELYCTSAAYVPVGATESCAVCAPRPTAGQPCGGGYYCAKDLYCRPDDWSMSDRGGTCRAPEPDGGACISGDQCQSGFCKRPSGALGTCDPGGKAGAACTAMSDCRYPLFCDPPTSRCEAPRAPGAACTLDLQCGGRHCDTASGQCGVPEGGACRSGSDCRSGFCNSTTRLCGVKKAAGEACTSYEECQSGECRNRVCFERCGSERPCPAGQYCAWDTQQCRALGADGSACEDDETCLSGWCSAAERCGKKPAVGDPCTRSSECYPLGYCAGGKCAARLAPGDACTALDSCREPFLCLRGHCELINLACAPARTGTMCAYLRICEASAYCDVQDAFTCKPRKPAGQSCLQTSECAGELFCRTDGASGPVCAARLAAGSACQGDQCAPGLHCVGQRGSSTCQAGPAGQPCSTALPCPEGFHCNDDGACMAPLPLGGDCLREYGVPCAEGLYCDFSNGCRPKKSLGEPCSSSAPCAESLRCLGGPSTCQPRAKLGESCSSSSSAGEDGGCEAGLFCQYDSTLKMTVCQAARPAGEPCNAANQCTTGTCGQSQRCVTTTTCKPPTP
jgi:hypothetical protein